MRNTLYLAVTSDEYELPIAVADDAQELGRLLGCSPYTVWSGVRRSQRWKDGRPKQTTQSGVRYYEVPYIPDNHEEEQEEFI